MDHISRVGVFIEVAKKESFAGAARALGMTGPAISKQVQVLEERLGVKLLNRTTRHVSLTEEGAVYFELARKAIDDLSEAEQKIQELKACPTGKLKVNAPMSFGREFLVQPIASFAKKYPDVELEVDFDDRRVDVIEEGYDVVVRIGVLEDSSLIARKLSSCPILLCASKSFIKEWGSPDSVSSLAAYPCIIYNLHSQSEDWRYQGPDGVIGSQKLNRKFAANNGEMQMEACLQGVGVALLPIFTAAKHLESGALVEILPDYKTYPERGIYAVFPQNRYLSTRVRLFVDALTECSESFPW
jgi:DNA-binding transcriptional LysR family regulator